MLTVDQALEELVPLLQKQRLVAFVGSGISVDSGLPTWDKFLDNFISFCSEIRTTYGSKLKIIDELLPRNLIANASNERDKRPTHVAMVLKEALLALPKDDKHGSVRSNIERDFRRWFARQFDSREPNKKHHQLVGTSYPFILASNYDLLLEEAAKSLAAPYGTYSLFDKERVAAAIHQNEPAIIHIHGTYDEVYFDRVVFTAKDYIEVVKKKFPGSEFLLQTLFLRYSTVFFGYGASDPHLEDLVEELSYFLDFATDEDLPKTYLVVLKGKIAEDGIYERYKRRLRTQLIGIDGFQDYDRLLWGLNQAAPRHKSED